MHEVSEDGERVGNNAMRTATLDVHDETDAASIMFKKRVIQTLLPSVMRLVQFHSPFPTSLLSTAIPIHPASADQPILSLAPSTISGSYQGNFYFCPGNLQKSFSKRGKKYTGPPGPVQWKLPAIGLFTHRKS
jgi:hypothetical protein